MCARRTPRRVRNSTLNPQPPGKGESIAQLFPRLAREWHPNKNGDLTPSQISKGCSFVAWWRCCDCGHEWQAVVHNRTKGRGCPECGKRAKGRKLSRPKTGESLLEQHPAVASLWHPTKNGDLTSADVKPFSNKAVWWQCKRHSEHAWQRKVAACVKYDGSCPRCTCQTSEPEIRVFAELSWLFSGVESRFRVEGMEVDVFVKGLNVGVEYDGYHWHSSKYDEDERKGRALAKAGVTLVRVREQPLEKVMPSDVVTTVRGELRKEDMNAVVLTIANLASDVNSERINEYVKRRDFANDTVYRKYLAYLPDPFPEHSLAQRCPDVAAEFSLERNYPLTPRNFAEKSNRSVWWKCGQCGGEWVGKINNRVRGRAGCGRCNRRQAGRIHATPDQNGSLADLYPTLAAEWLYSRNNDLRPTEVKPRSNVPVWWKCSKCGREWRSQVNHRSRGHGCDACGRKEAAKKRRTPKAGRSFGDLYPAVSCEWHASKNGDLRPSDVKAKSSMAVWWKCSTCGRVWQAKVSSRARGSGCGHCGIEKSASARRVPLPGQSLADLSPALCAEWHPTLNATVVPSQLKAGSGMEVWWMCSVCGHEYRAAVCSRTRKSKASGCTKCGRKKTVLARKTPLPNKSIVDTHPELVSEWHPLKNHSENPGSYKSGSRAKVWWKCKDCDNEWQASIKKRTAGRGCPKCGRARTIAGRRRPRAGQSLADLFPDLAAEWFSQRNGDLSPSDFRKSSMARAWWKCRICGHEWNAVVCKRTSGHGCRMCAIARRRRK